MISPRIATATAALALTVAGVGVGVATAAADDTAAPPAATATATQQGDHRTTHGEHRDRHVPRVAERWAEAWNTSSPEAMAALFAEDGTYTDHAFGATFTGPDGAAQWVGITSTALSDVQVDVQRAFRAGDQVAVQWEFTATDTGGLGPGAAPTGKTFTVPAATVITLRHGKIASVDDYYNLADVMAQVAPDAAAGDAPAGSTAEPAPGTDPGSTDEQP